MHYGRERVQLARQLAMLEPGRYQLSMNVSGSIGMDGQLRWLVRCMPSERTVLDLPLRSGPRIAGAFEVRPSACGAYQVELVGLPQEAPSSSDATISQLRLAKVAR